MHLAEPTVWEDTDNRSMKYLLENLEYCQYAI